MKIIHFADLHLGVETYGHTDPKTGLSSRLVDFLAAFDQLVDYALEQCADLVLFCGDAYKSREPSPTQQREFARRIHRLAGSGIPVFLLIGNHDLPNAVGRATATEIFDTLSIENVHVAGRPGLHKINTPSGPVQIVSLPWLRKSTLLSREETKNLTTGQINERLQAALAEVVSSQAAQLDPALPALLAAHVWVVGAQLSSEATMTIGQEHTMLLSNVAHPAFDYIALGHIHRHQVLCENPPVVYSGSLERVSFNEEGDDKGFYMVDIDRSETGQRQTSYEFHPVPGRNFLTVDITINNDDIAPTATVINELNHRAEAIRDGIVRLNITLPAGHEGQLSNREIRNALREADYAVTSYETVRERRLRLGNRTPEEISPLEALRAYLESKQVPAERIVTLLRHAEELLADA